MNKTLGQIAHKEFSVKYATPRWENLSPAYREYWQQIARTVIAEHEKSKTK